MGPLTPLDWLALAVFGLAWIGYANPLIREQVEPVLQDVLRERGLL